METYSLIFFYNAVKLWSSTRSWAFSPWILPSYWARRYLSIVRPAGLDTAPLPSQASSWHSRSRGWPRRFPSRRQCRQSSSARDTGPARGALRCRGGMRRVVYTAPRPLWGPRPARCPRWPRCSPAWRCGLCPGPGRSTDLKPAASNWAGNPESELILSIS